MSKKTRPYRELLLERLGNPTVAAHYLDAAMEESQESYLKALRNVARANQMAKVAKDTGVQRESLYRILSEQGNPTLETLLGIYDSVGLKLASVPKENERKGQSDNGDSLFESIAKHFSPVNQINEMVGAASAEWFMKTATTNAADFISPVGQKYEIKPSEMNSTDTIFLRAVSEVGSTMPVTSPLQTRWIVPETKSGRAA
jgi:probable addiction module antidote protein